VLKLDAVVDWGTHILAGQAWSLLTQNKVGIVPRQMDRLAQHQLGGTKTISPSSKGLIPPIGNRSAIVAGLPGLFAQQPHHELRCFSVVYHMQFDLFSPARRKQLFYDTTSVRYGLRLSWSPALLRRSTVHMA